MKRILPIILCFIISGCSILVPTKIKFPKAPEEILVKCPRLAILKDDAKLSDVAKNVTDNYSTYYQCAVKNDAWIEWYQIQKRIFDGVK